MDVRGGKNQWKDFTLYKINNSEGSQNNTAFYTINYYLNLKLLS